MDQRTHYEKAEMCLDLSEQADPEDADRLLKAAQVHAHLAGDYKPPEEWNIGRAKISHITLTDSGGEAHSTGAALQFPDEPVDVTEEPPAGSRLVDCHGHVWRRGGRGWGIEGLIPGSNFDNPWSTVQQYAPLRTTTDADRERVGLPTVNTPEGTAPGDTAPDVDPDEALRFIHPDAYDRERKWHGEQRVRAEKAEAEVTRLTYLLGSHADGHQCTCTEINPGAEGISPPEWEQDPWCPTHPDMNYVTAEVKRLRERTEEAEAAMREEVAEHDKTRATVLRLTRERDVAEARCERLSVLAEKGERYEALRAGIEALAEKWEHAVDDLNPLSSLGRALLMYGPDDLRALLNPTEGETDDRR